MPKKPISEYIHEECIELLKSVATRFPHDDIKSWVESEIRYRYERMKRDVSAESTYQRKLITDREENRQQLLDLQQRESIESLYPQVTANNPPRMNLDI